MNDVTDTLAGSEVWSEFCDRLKAVGSSALAKSFPDPSARAEALRLAGRHLATALDWCLTADPSFPRFTYINNKGTYLNHEDMCQIAAPVRGDAVYRVVGNVSSLYDVIISVHDGPLQRARSWGELGLDALETDADGNFTLIVGGDRVPGNWIELKPEAVQLSIRQYCYDWSRHRPGTFEIMRVGGENEAPRRLTPAHLAARLHRVPEFVTEIFEAFDAAWKLQSQVPENALGPPTGAAAGSSHVLYGWGQFRLQTDEALIITFEKPEAKLWTVQWLVAPWLSNPDMINRITSVHGTDAHIDTDGRVRVVVSPADPGLQNWLDVEGYEQGLLAYRWIRTINKPTPTATLVKLTELREHLPAATPPFSPEARARQRAERRRQMAWRGR